MQIVLYRTSQARTSGNEDIQKIMDVNEKLVKEVKDEHSKF
jgi:hypothetical protein